MFIVLNIIIIIITKSNVYFICMLINVCKSSCSVEEKIILFTNLVSFAFLNGFEIAKRQQTILIYIK